MRQLFAITLVVGLVLMPGCKSGGSAGDSGGDTTPKAGDEAKIEDVNWRLVELRSAPAQPVPADAREAHLRLSSSDHRVAGFAGVNSFSGSYQAQNQPGSLKVKFGPLAMTKKAGPANLMQQEGEFSRALSNTAWCRRSGGRMELMDAGGTVLARFEEGSASR